MGHESIIEIRTTIVNLKPIIAGVILLMGGVAVGWGLRSVDYRLTQKSLTHKEIQSELNNIAITNIRMAVLRQNGKKWSFSIFDHYVCLQFGTVRKKSLDTNPKLVYDVK